MKPEIFENEMGQAHGVALCSFIHNTCYSGRKAESTVGTNIFNMQGAYNIEQYQILCM